MIDSSTTDLCHCGKPGLFGYKDESGKMVWYCGEHRLAQHWADARVMSLVGMAPIAAIPRRDIVI